MRQLGRLWTVGAVISLLALVPVLADRQQQLKPSAAETASATGATVSASGKSVALIVLDITAGSGTVTDFRVFIEGSVDGTIFAALPCDVLLDAAAADPGAGILNQRDIIDVATVTTTGTFYCKIKDPPSRIRAQWVVVGTSPSETFSIEAVLR